MNIRTFKDADLQKIKDITTECFDGVCIDQNIENLFGVIDGKNWQYRKKLHIDNDARSNAKGIFVAENEGDVIGYISTQVNLQTKIGSISNFAVLPKYRGKGLGKMLMEKAFSYFKEKGMLYARIETLEQNEIGKHLYPKLGFKDVARQIHYAMPL